MELKTFVLAATLAVVSVPANAATGPKMEAAINLSGLEINSGTLPGRPNWDYAIPTTSELSYYRGKGINTVRLPILWERLQPNLFNAQPSATLDSGYLSIIKAFLATAASQNMSVIVDLHNYGGYGKYKFGSTELSAGAFAALWKSLAQSLQGSPGLLGYDLMNEPNGMPSASAWPQAAQAAVDAIRTVDRNSIICVEGDNWASAGSWISSNGNLNVKDAAGRLLYEAHVYGDHNNSGSNFNWNSESAAGVTVNTIAQRVAVFSSWCKNVGAACFIGEVGVGNDSPQWNAELATGLAAMKTGGMMAFAYWAGGPWWGNYPMSLEPTVRGDAKQMAVVSAFAK